MNIIPERIAVLEKEIIKSSPGWRAGFTRNSLFGLGEWVKKSATMRTIGHEEIEEEIRINNLEGIQAQLTREQKEKLSPGSERIRFDAGIYLGETLRLNLRYLEWAIERRKTNIYYNSPVLIKMEEKKAIILPWEF